MRGLGGKSDRDVTGDKRVWKFNAKDIDRFSKVYKHIPDTIEIEEQELQSTLDSGMTSDTEETEFSDTSDTSDTL
jgi:hypothetical protein